MDFHQQPYPNIDPKPYQSRHSEKMATASMVLGIVATVTSGCVYPALVCGSLGIILALLSRGGEMKLSNQGKIGLILGVLGLISGIAFFIFAFYTVIHTYGSFDNFMKEYMELYNSLAGEL